MNEAGGSWKNASQIESNIMTSLEELHKAAAELNQNLEMLGQRLGPISNHQKAQAAPETGIPIEAASPAMELIKTIRNQLRESFARIATINDVLDL